MGSASTIQTRSCWTCLESRPCAVQRFPLYLFYLSRDSCAETWLWRPALLCSLPGTFCVMSTLRRASASVGASVSTSPSSWRPCWKWKSRCWWYPLGAASTISRAWTSTRSGFPGLTFLISQVSTETSLTMSTNSSLQVRWWSFNWGQTVFVLVPMWTSGRLASGLSVCLGAVLMFPALQVNLVFPQFFSGNISEVYELCVPSPLKTLAFWWDGAVTRRPLPQRPCPSRTRSLGSKSHSYLKENTMYVYHGPRAGEGM